ncbi:TfoX/Sxy family DNA transformation protein [Aestuariibius sp. 2305UL40-4]|uniref:TfoX/Sxy family DNA transformation protein n=1 Tax=Aestuariibius violaceus TaxID=3234132 RepID=UPI00345EBB4C
MAAITTIRNLGPAMERDFRKCGLTTAEEIRALGADEVYGRLIGTGVRPHFAAFLALVMGLQDRDWLSPDPTEKAQLRKRFDSIRSVTKDAQTGIEAELDRLGIRPNQGT